MYDPFPSMSKVYSLVLQEKSHKSFGHGGSSSTQADVIAMYANLKSNFGNTTWNRGNGKKEMPFCIHYNIPRHTIEKCYKLHGYPLKYKPKVKGNATASQVSSNLSNGAENPSIASSLCLSSKAQCEQLLAYLTTGFGVGDAHYATTVRASSVVGVEGDLGGALDMVSSQPQTNLSTCSNLMSGTSSKIPYIPNLTHSIFSAKIINREAFRESDWVIDTRAIDHIVYSVPYFTSITSTLTTHVNLPNGEIAFVTHIGTVRILESLILYNILCVPSFTFNLISISQLAKSILCCLIFFGNLCFIQDLALWSTIGLGKEINGLYLLKRRDSTSTSSCFSSFISISINKTKPYIWHARLRHLSNAKLALLNKNNVSLINSNEKFRCDICPLAKQKRLPFNTSSHISNECFDLIHCDLWGLFSVSTIDGFRFFLTIVDDCSKCT